MQKKSRNFSRRLLTIGTVLVMLFGATFGSVLLAYSQYNKAYSIPNILSEYQAFVRYDLTTNNHFVGSIAVGDELKGTLNFGEAQLVPSYVNNVVSFSNFNANVDWVAGNKNKEFLYTIAGVGIQQWQKDLMTAIGSTDYVDFTEAFTELENQSLIYANTGTASGTLTGSTLTIDLSSGSKRVTISAQDFDAASRIQLNGVSVSDFSNEYVLSIIGINGSSFNLDSQKIFLGDSPLPITNALKSLSTTVENGQVNLGDMRLLWNLPDATGDVSVNFGSGHIIAPKASVTMTGGNFEGGIIASSLTSSSEAHFYPYSYTTPYTTPDFPLETNPTDPTTPSTDPTDPTTPTTVPTDPTTPSTDPTDPTTPSTDPTDPTTPSTDPTDPTTPSTDPTDPTTPSTDPTDLTTPSTDPTDLTTPSTDPTLPTYPTTPTQPTNVPNESTEPTASPTNSTSPTTKQTEATSQSSQTTETATASTTNPTDIGGADATTTGDKAGDGSSSSDQSKSSIGKTGESASYTTVAAIFILIISTIALFYLMYRRQVRKNNA